MNMETRLKADTDPSVNLAPRRTTKRGRKVRYYRDGDSSDTDDDMDPNTETVYNNRLSRNQPSTPSASEILIPDKTNCLICCSDCSGNKDPIGKSESTFLSKNMMTIFILRQLLELPLSEVGKYLSYCPNPSEWIVTCDKCTEFIKNCQSIYSSLMTTSREFEKAKLELVEMIKQSIIRNDSNSTRKLPSIADASRCFVNNHSYAGFKLLSNPFIDGDKGAEQLGMSCKKGRAASIRLHSKIVMNDRTSCSVKKEKANPAAKHAANAKTSKKAKTSLNDEINTNNVEIDKVTVKEEVSGDEAELELADDFMDYNSTEDPEWEKTEKRNDVRVKRKKREKRVSRQKKLEKNEDDDEWEVDDIQEGDFEKDVASDEEGETGEINIGIGTMEITCPSCVQFKCKVTKGEVLCQHLETCVGGVITTCKNETPNVSVEVILSCPICQNFSKPVTEKITFAEHLGVCKGILDVSAGDSSLKGIKMPPLNCRIFQCDLCPEKRFMKLNRFVCHYLHHKKMSEFECVECAEKFASKQLLNAHWQSKHWALFKTVRENSRYIKSVAAVPFIPWWCPHCHDKFSSEQVRHEHIESAHSSRDSSQQELETHKCPDCKNSYFSEEEAKMHWNTCHLKGSKFVYCELCYEVFEGRKLYIKHRKHVHKRGLYSCPMCDNKYCYRNGLMTHLDSHTNDKAKLAEITCPTCNKVVCTKYALANHIDAVHNNVIKYSCEVCGRGFKETTSFKRHLANVHQIGSWRQKYLPCPMPECTHKSRNKSELDVHLSRKHMKEPKFKCSYCGKDFYFQHLLNKHEKTHTDPITAEDMRYECGTCSKRFFDKRIYFQHIKIHDPNRIRRYQPREEKPESQKTEAFKYSVCEVCGRLCGGPRLLNSHKWEEHPEFMKGQPKRAKKVYNCDICGERARGPKMLKRHKRKEHPDSMNDEQTEKNNYGFVGKMENQNSIEDRNSNLDNVDPSSNSCESGWNFPQSNR